MANRITFSQINTLVQSNLSRNYAKLSKFQEQLSSGRRIMRPSDAPVDVAIDLGFRSELKHLNQLKRNIDDGAAFLSVTETTASRTNDVYQRIRELAIQGSNDTNTGDERNFIKNEVRVALDTLLGLANQTFKGGFVFSGTETTTPPFALVTGQETIDSVDNTGTDSTDTFLNAGPLPQTIQLWDRNVTDSNTASGNAQAVNIIPGELEIAGLDEGTDYSIDYAAGTITFLDGPQTTIPGVGNLTKAQIMAATPATYPAWPPVGDPSWPAGSSEPQPGGGMTVDYDWIRRSEKNLDGKIQRQIDSGVETTVNITASEMFGESGEMSSWEAIIVLMDGLHTNRGETIRDSISGVKQAFDRSLEAQSISGSRVNRMNLIKETNEDYIVSTTRLQSTIEDVDFADLISKFMLQESVYNASLQAGARVIQPTLSNFI